MKYFLNISALLAPTLVLAAFGSLSDIESFITGLVNLIVNVLVTFIFVLFLWGMVKAIWLSTGEESKKEAYNLIRFSLISLVAVLSLWGVVRLAQNTFFG